MKLRNLLNAILSEADTPTDKFTGKSGGPPAPKKKEEKPVDPNATESGESDAARQAHELGLVSKGYGNWGDPQSGETVAKTVKGQLVKIEKDAEAGKQYGPKDGPLPGAETDMAAKGQKGPFSNTPREPHINQYDNGEGVGLNPPAQKPNTGLVGPKAQEPSTKLSSMMPNAAQQWSPDDALKSMAPQAEEVIKKMTEMGEDGIVADAQELLNPNISVSSQEAKSAQVGALEALLDLSDAIEAFEAKKIKHSQLKKAFDRFEQEKNNFNSALNGPDDSPSLPGREAPRRW